MAGPRTKKEDLKTRLVAAGTDLIRDQGLKGLRARDDSHRCRGVPGQPRQDKQHPRDKHDDRSTTRKVQRDGGSRGPQGKERPLLAEHGAKAASPRGGLPVVPLSRAA